MPAQEIHTEWAKTLAEQLVASGDVPPAGLSDAERLALAWALKDLAIAAWSTDQTLVPRASTTLAALLSAANSETKTASNREISAVSDWVGGMGDITRGRMSDAIRHLERADVGFQVLGLAAPAAHTHVAKIIALSTLGRHREAAECGMLAYEEFMRLGELHAAGKVSLNLGHLHFRCNNFVRAKEHFGRATDLFSDVCDPARFVMSEVGMADAHASLGDFDAALEVYDRCESNARDNDLPVVGAVIQESIGLVHLARGNYREALGGLEASRRRYEELAMPQHLATAEKQLADAYVDLRLLPEAISLFDRALERFKALEMPVDQAWTLTQRGRALSSLGRSPQEVADSFSRAAMLFSAQGITAGSASISLARAELSLSLGQPDDALLHALDATNSFTASGMKAGRTHSNLVTAYALLQTGDAARSKVLFKRTLSEATTLQLHSLRVRCLVGIGLASLNLSDTQGAQAHFELAVATFEEQRSALPGDDLRQAFLVNHMRPYEELLRIALKAAAVAPSRDNACSVLTRLERCRARALHERLGEESSQRNSAETDGAMVQMRSRLCWLHRRSQKLLDDSQGNELLLVEAREIELELLERARRRRLTTTASGASNDGADVNATLLQLALGADEMVVEYGVLDDEVFACVITRGGVALRRHVAKWPDVVVAIRVARFQIETLRNGAGELNKHLDLLTRRSQMALCRVYDLIWAPLSDLLLGCHRVLVVPHEQLGSVPFSALHDGEQYLSQRYDISVAPSARVALRGLGRQPLPPRRALILGESSRLVHAVEEAQFVASLFDEATVLTGQDANGDALRAASTQADVLHLACHGQFRSDNPMFSALHLVDGPFTVQDAEALRLPQGVVVLSACESGVATASKGDEVIGLVRAFLIAGAARVVASLWPVDDKVTTEFMAVFYSSLRAGASPATALRSAQLEVMKTHPHPFHWAAFTVYGGW